MKNERLFLLILAIIQFTHILDFMIIMPLGNTLMNAFQITPTEFSLIVSSYSFAAFIMSLVSALFIDRFDRKKALMILYVGFTIGTLACSFAPNYLFFLIARSLTGAFGGIISALILSIIADSIPYQRRSEAMGIVMTGFSAASVLGVPAGIQLAAMGSWSTPFLILGLMSAGVCFLIFFVVPQLRKHLEGDQTKENPFIVIRKIFKTKNQTNALSFNVILMLGHFTIIPFIAPYMEMNIGFTETHVAAIYFFGGLLTVVLLPLFGRLADRHGNVRIFAFGTFVAILSIFMITNLPKVGIALALCVTSTFFVGGSSRNVPALTMVTSVVQPENRGSFMSIRASFVQLTLGLSSFIAGLIIVKNEDGTLGNYHLVGYLAIAMSLVALWIAPKLKAIKGN